MFSILLSTKCVVSRGDRGRDSGKKTCQGALSEFIRFYKIVTLTHDGEIVDVEHGYAYTLSLN
jgi:hypothetical protein